MARAVPATAATLALRASARHGAATTRVNAAGPIPPAAPAGSALAARFAPQACVRALSVVHSISPVVAVSWSAASVYSAVAVSARFHSAKPAYVPRAPHAHNPHEQVTDTLRRSEEQTP